MKKLSQSAEEIVKQWLKSPYDQETRNEIKELMKNQPEEIETAFTTELKFGTAGLRAKMGPGPGRMNKYTIRIVTQGLADYIKTFPKEQWSSGVAICYDCRLHSREFAEETAKVLAGNQIPVHLVPELRPTPFVSFALRYYKCIAGINITASHNPKEYNGYKVYWSDGAQIVSPHDREIVKSIENVTDINQVLLTDLNDPLISFIPHSIEDAYLDAVCNLSINKDLIQNYGKDLKIIYSPLNGAGITMIPKALKQCGFNNVKIVQEQKHPDGTFPTTPYPNPETDKALELGWRDLKKDQADILLVSDPDSDRLSCSVLCNGQPKRLTGNELGTLLLHYLVTELKPEGKWATVTTIVSTELVKKLTETNYGTCFEVLTGFKYIGEKIHQWEQMENGFNFLFGMEESLGYLHGTHARDKDATIAATLTAELTLNLKKHGKTLLNQLYEIYTEFGIHREDQLTVDAQTNMPTCVEKIESLRKSPPKTLCNVPIISIEDYLTSKSIDYKTNSTNKLDLPKANVLIFRLEDQSKFIIRPSGTEPKIKIYGQIVGSAQEFPSMEDGIHTLDKRLKSRLEEINKEVFG